MKGNLAGRRPVDWLEPAAAQLLLYYYTSKITNTGWWWRSRSTGHEWASEVVLVVMRATSNLTSYHVWQNCVQDVHHGVCYSMKVDGKLCFAMLVVVQCTSSAL